MPAKTQQSIFVYVQTLLWLKDVLSGRQNQVFSLLWTAYHAWNLWYKSDKAKKKTIESLRGVLARGQPKLIHLRMLV